MTGPLGDYEVLVDSRRPPSTAPTLDLPAGFPVLEAAEVLETLFQRQDRLDEVQVTVGGQRVGALTRQRIEITARGIGDGDGASLPGHSPAYELLEFRCGSCTTVVYRLHVDPRDPPICPEGHGPLTPAP
jgi:hypothetical protein